MSDYNIISNSSRIFSTNYEYDTIGIYIDIRKLSEKEFDRLVEYFEIEKIKENRYKGKKKGFHFYCDSFRVYISGSFSNYQIGKYKPLPIKYFEEAVYQLSNEIGVELHDWLLNRIDINWNYITNKNVEAYDKRLFVDSSRFTRLERDNGVIFRNKQTELEIYNRSDKIGDSVKNWIRIEYRIRKNVNKRLGIKFLYELFEQESFFRALGLFKKCFDNLNKAFVTIDDYKKITTPKLLRKYLEIKGLETIGLDTTFRLIDEMDELGGFKNSDQKYRFRKSITDLSKNESICDIHPLAKELIDNFNLDFEDALKETVLN